MNVFWVAGTVGRTLDAPMVGATVIVGTMLGTSLVKLANSIPVHIYSTAASTNPVKFIIPTPVTGSQPLAAAKPWPQLSKSEVIPC